MDFNQLTKDFNQRYSNSWVFITFPGGETEFVLLKKAYLKEEDKFPLIELYSKDLGTNTIRFTTDYKIRFSRPQIGLFQWGKHAYCCERSTEQTYSKGLNENSYHLPAMVYKVCGVTPEYYAQGNKWGECVKHAFDPVYPTKDRAIEMLNSGKYISVALSKRVGLALSATDTDSFDVYFYTNFLGKTDKHGVAKFNATDLGITEL